MFLTDMKILLKFDINNCEKDELLLYLEKVVRRKVLNYCNLNSIPLSHEYIVADLVANYYNLVYYPKDLLEVNNSPSTRAIPVSGAIKKETIGDYSVEYATESSGGSSTSTTTKITSTIALDDLLNDYKSQLNQIRKLRF